MLKSDLLTKWTAIITNIAVVIGLVFVGLEFRNNTRAVEADRIDSFIEGAIDIETIAIENEDLSEILYQSYASPQSLTGSDLDRVQHWMILQYNNFLRVYLAHQSGLFLDELFENQKQAIGFAFSSDIGRSTISLMRASTLGDEAWELISESAEQARVYCLDSSNECIARYQAARDTGS